MKQKVNTISVDTGDTYPQTVELECECPICGIVLVPDVISGVSLNHSSDHDDEYDKKVIDEDNKVFLINYCPYCDECFISRHIYNIQSDFYSIQSSAPIKHNNHYFSENIQNLSPDFVKIYSESLIAEKSGLLSI